MGRHPRPLTALASPSPGRNPPETITASGRDPLPAGPFGSYQRLGIRVIQQALRDLECASPDLRESARLFFDGGPLLHLWCEVADIGPSRVMARAAATQAPGTDWSGPHGRHDASTPIARLASANASVS